MFFPSVPDATAFQKELCGAQAIQQTSAARSDLIQHGSSLTLIALSDQLSRIVDS
ncbi:hypothetical protein DAPPUDRAFT_262531 [Daphnia pulex]|uniref:Uncharacterized protein n=1 Tax=Daphnia pulex TaxID=6669 RepID=E9HN57_DAPPU|nr:hypothetical protein DAPPUDRAFT_262531 [Daphnia pulex]|eukprot:EFX66822.1 hypothetical protein DAPPUDRAFT_262531 [Daphnia pulex]